MATEVGGMPNGYAHHQGYAGIDQNSYGYAANAAASQAPAQQVPPTSSTPSNAQPQPQSEISKDEVGWYFVEQYYTTLSRSPEKLYLFYNKRSQFVSGQETDKVPVCVGQRAINDKIRDLDFQDCKVRVTNVDSQSSDSNIVIQVIGEISNKGQPHKKFTQTFVLATQTNGYFVLNDIFRYLVEEEDEPETETAQQVEDAQQVSGTESGFQEPPPTEAEPKTLTKSADPAAVEHDAAQVGKGLEEKVVNHVEEETALVVNGEHAEIEEPAVEETPATTAPETIQSNENERPSTTESEVQPEKPKDPEPTPIASPPNQAAPQPAPAPKPAGPAAPKTWANLAAAANRVATPATPAAPQTAASSSKPATKAAPTAPSAPAATPAAATPSGPAAQRQEPAASDSQDEWTAVGGSHNRQQSRQANVPQPEQPQHRGYIKNVHENVDYDELKAELEKFGELSYFDIARQKNCAFVDFKTADGYNAALNVPFELGGEKIFVEERRIRQGSTPYIPRGQFQGGRGGRGGAGGQGAPRGNFQGGRGGNAPQKGGRGNFAPQRGGRGGAQA
ncbi:hypothetical protein M409DRAFT_69567 [Zasmidium cellare ATCC 36951]|uniref:NTF2 domain-containing protein n=1 Tax=Zasmidium cellare ATCC 36951 TaxID=1080233 RepID=A0A6A6C4A9_ZASCE|nr:uncharacterized protein M409DRAFT_69567 [Zasmidium cellare ATCC 36951]KAF2161763.1 hypothetical protein M409DRAFT_69567 [Zasmidium cellare ATCC 36951]